MNIARRTLAFVAAACTLVALGACAKGSSSVDEDLTQAAGGPLDEENLCGNGIIDEDHDEECDRTDDGDKLGRATCESLGFSAGGKLTCDPELCIYDTSLCKLPVTMTPTGGTGG